MDNRSIDLTLEGRQDFNHAMRIAIGNKKTTGYRLHENCMVLYWTESKNSLKLPYPMDTEQTINMVWGWLEYTKPDYPQPDHDGDNGKGFKIFNEAWGHVFGEWQAYIAIQPVWAMYGK